MELKELLGEELYAQVDKKISEHNDGIEDKKNHVRFVDLSEGKYVSKEKYDSTHLRLTDTTKLLDTANAEIKAYKEMDIDGIKKRADDWEQKYNTDINALNEKLLTQQKEIVADKFLNGQGFKSKLALKEAQRGLMQLEFKDGEFVNAKSYIDDLKKNDPDSFEVQEPETEPKPNPYNFIKPNKNKTNPVPANARQAYLKNKYGNNKYYVE